LLHIRIASHWDLIIISDCQQNDHVFVVTHNTARNLDPEVMGNPLFLPQKSQSEDTTTLRPTTPPKFRRIVTGIAPTIHSITSSIALNPNPSSAVLSTSPGSSASLPSFPAFSPPPLAVSSQDDDLLLRKKKFSEDFLSESFHHLDHEPLARYLSYFLLQWWISYFIFSAFFLKYSIIAVELRRREENLCNEIKWFFLFDIHSVCSHYYLWVHRLRLRKITTTGPDRWAIAHASALC
jgi:hypothetical protein